jgi:hypothetical protein
MQKNILGGLMSDKISQKQAVVNAVKKVLGSSYDTSEPVRRKLTPDNVKFIKQEVYDGIINGSVAYSKDNSDLEGVKKYVPGLVSNHLRKAKELNGNVKFNATTQKHIENDYNTDPVVKQLEERISTMTPGSPQYKSVSAAIKHAKKWNSEIEKELKPFNLEEMPEELQDLTKDLAGDNITQ